jgi:ABC-type cobalamin/Fe3+-siderophores transport system ATPase subunit
MPFEHKGSLDSDLLHPHKPRSEVSWLGASGLDERSEMRYNEGGTSGPAGLSIGALAPVRQEGDMHLVSLEVKGLKSLRETRVDGLDHYNVFIGKNDSGKSTILQAVRLLQALQDRVGLQAPEEIIADKAERGVVHMTAVFSLSDEELGGIPGTVAYRGDPVLERLRTWRFGFEMRHGYSNWYEGRTYLTECGPVQGDDLGRFWALKNPENRRAEYHALDSAQLTQVLRHAERPLAEALACEAAPPQIGGSFLPDGQRWPDGFNWGVLRQFVASMVYLSPKREISDKLAAQQSLSLAPSGENLTQVLDTLKANYPQDFEAVATLLSRLFPDLAEVYLTREQEHAVLRIASEPKRDATEAFRVSEVGTGIQQALMIATAALSSPDGAVILLEEPENNLHPGAQRELAAWLREQVINWDKQILITTHSTIFASTAEHCSTYLVRLDDEEGTRVRKLEPGDEAAVKEELGLRNVDLYGCDMVVLCEGDSEMVAMPIILNALARKRGTTLSGLGLAWRNLGGSGNSRVKWVEEFLRLLRDIDVQPYIMADDDPSVREGLERLVRREALDSEAYHIWVVDKAQLDRNASVTSEFEDNWTNEQLVDVASEMAVEDGIDLELDAAGFAKLCVQSEKRTSKVLEDYCWTEKRYDLDKKELNRRLAFRVAEELTGDAERTVEEYEFEKVARDIFRKLGGLYVEETSDLGGEE